MVASSVGGNLACDASCEFSFCLFGVFPCRKGGAGFGGFMRMKSMGRAVALSISGVSKLLLRDSF